MPKVSVIMGVYNVGDGIKLREAVNSILLQTFKDFEFIICDDGSIDNTHNIIQELASIDDRIKILKNNYNMGLAKTLNKCIEYSKGTYIARMDDDDYSYINRLQKEFDFLEKNKEFDFVSSSIDIYNGEEITGSQKKIQFPQKKDFLWGNCFVHPATMFRKSSLQKVNGYRIAKETRRAEDYDLYMRLYASGSRGYNFQEKLLRYYISKESMRKRKFIYRVDECIVRFKGFKNLGLKLNGGLYILKPILVGMLPKSFMIKIQHNFYNKE